MIGLATILACFWQMFRVYRIERANPMPANVCVTLSQPVWQVVWMWFDMVFGTKGGEFWRLLGWILNVLLWAFWGFVGFMKQATAKPDPLRFSHYKVPEYWQPEEDELPKFKTEPLPKAPNEIISEKVIYENTGQSKPA